MDRISNNPGPSKKRGRPRKDLADSRSRIEYAESIPEEALAERYPRREKSSHRSRANRDSGNSSERRGRPREDSTSSRARSEYAERIPEESFAAERRVHRQLDRESVKRRGRPDKVRKTLGGGKSSRRRSLSPGGRDTQSSLESDFAPSVDEDTEQGQERSSGRKDKLPAGGQRARKSPVEPPSAISTEDMDNDDDSETDLELPSKPSRLEKSTRSTTAPSEMVEYDAHWATDDERELQQGWTQQDRDELEAIPTWEVIALRKAKAAFDMVVYDLFPRGEKLPEKMSKAFSESCCMMMMIPAFIKKPRSFRYAIQLAMYYRLRPNRRKPQAVVVEDRNAKFIREYREKVGASQLNRTSEVALAKMLDEYFGPTQTKHHPSLHHPFLNHLKDAVRKQHKDRGKVGDISDRVASRDMDAVCNAWSEYGKIHKNLPAMREVKLSRGRTAAGQESVASIAKAWKKTWILEKRREAARKINAASRRSFNDIESDMGSPILGAQMGLLSDREATQLSLSQTMQVVMESRPEEVLRHHGASAIYTASRRMGQRSSGHTASVPGRSSFVAEDHGGATTARRTYVPPSSHGSPPLERREPEDAALFEEDSEFGRGPSTRDNSPASGLWEDGWGDTLALQVKPDHDHVHNHCDFGRRSNSSKRLRPAGEMYTDSQSLKNSQLELEDRVYSEAVQGDLAPGFQDGQMLS